MKSKDETKAAVEHLKKLQTEFHTANAQHLDYECRKTTKQINREVERARKHLVLCAATIDCDVVLAEFK